MLIGIDGNEANVRNRVGVNKYAFEILRGIHKLLPQNNDLIVCVYLKGKPLPGMPSENKRFKYKVLRGGKVWIVTKLTPYLLSTKEKPDVFFTPSHYLPLITTMPKVCAIMDLGYLENSAHFTKYDFWQLKYWTAWSVKISKAILTISNATKESIGYHYPLSKDKVVVSYPGADEYLTHLKVSDTQIKKVMKKYSIVNDYILYLGTLKPSKNIEGLIKAYKETLGKTPATQLVIAGKKGWLYESIFKIVRELNLSDNVVFTDFIEESDKATLIKGAKLFILPSFWEGFGLDILTAFSLRVPVIASNAGSLPEVVGNAGILVDPNKTESISRAIVKILNLNRADYDKLIAKEQMQLKNFSWSKASEITIGVLRKAANVS